MNVAAIEGRIIVSADLEYKNQHTFSNGQTIRIERQYNNLNKRETEPVNVTVIDGIGIPAGAEILVHHNALHPINQLFNLSQVSGEYIADSVKHFSIPESMCFLWRNPGERWQPMKGFATAMRVFEPVQTRFYGIAPKLLKETLYITSGHLTGQVVNTVRAADYEIVFRNEKGVEDRTIRLRHFENEKSDREEVIAINHALTEMVHDGKLLVGYSVTNCSKLIDYKVVA